MTKWHDEDTWWEQAHQLLFSDSQWEQASAQASAVLALAGMVPPLRLLDMPCGPGRHSLAFARLGCSVTGVDRTAAYVEEARRRAASADLDVTFAVGDMRRFRRPDSFDLAVNLNTSFGYFDNPEEDLVVLRNFHASLRPGGTLLLEMMGKEILARIFQAREWQEFEDGSLFLQERQIGRDWTWFEGRWLLLTPDGARREQFFEHRLYGASDLKRVLRTAGFAEIEIYGGLEGLDYDQDALRLVAVARKPETA